VENLGWLKALHHFYVGARSNPAHEALGNLYVWNDDELAPGTGFPLHPHRDVEIILTSARVISPSATASAIRAADRGGRCGR